jgi:hypothetical protein
MTEGDFPSNRTTISRRALIASMGAIGAGLTAAGLGFQSGIQHAETKASFGLVTTTIAALRLAKSPSPEPLYLVTDTGKEGFFVVDPNGKDEEDDNDSMIVGADGVRFIRLTRHNRSGSLASFEYASMNEDYESIIDISKAEYSYEEMLQDIDQLCAAYPDRVRKIIIGRTVLGRDIPAVILGNPQAVNRLFVMASSHAREYHGTPIVMKQIEFYLRNWNRCYNGDSLSRIFQVAAIYYVPMHNPDGVALTQTGFGSIPFLQRDSLIPKMKAAVETKIRNHLATTGDLDTGYDLGVSTPKNYTFREKELIIWKTNANGVDLHYNFYEEGVNKQEFLAWTENASSDWWAKSFAAEDYRGPDGMSEPETAAVRDFIETYGLTKFAVTYHGRFPTIFWNYRQPYNNYIRDKEIVLDLANVTRSPVITDNSQPIGFVGWYIQKYGGFCANLEIGWGRFPIDPVTWQFSSKEPIDACPLKIEQFPYMWEAQKFAMLHLLQKYVAGAGNETAIQLPQPNHFSYDGYMKNMVAIRNSLNKLSLAGNLMDKLIYDSSVDVIDFGADPTGRKDSTNAFRFAFLSGKAVRADGTFLLTDSLTLRSNFVLKGSGSGRTKIVMKKGADKPIFRVVGDNISVEGVDLSFDDNNAALKSNQIAIRLFTNRHCSFKSMTISRCFKGIYLSSADSDTISSCSFDDITISAFKQNAIQLMGKSTNANNQLTNITIRNHLSEPVDDFAGKSADYAVHLANFMCASLENMQLSDMELDKHAVYIADCPLVNVQNIRYSGIKASVSAAGQALMGITGSRVLVNGLDIKGITLHASPASLRFYPLGIYAGSRLELRFAACENAKRIDGGVYDYMLNCSDDSRYEQHHVTITNRHDTGIMKFSRAPVYARLGYPHVTTAERSRLPNPFSGMYVYDTDLERIVVWNGSSWVNSDGTAL